MSWLKLFAAGLVIVASSALRVGAAPFEPAKVPAEAKWLLHVDVDALVASRTWKLVLPKIEEKPDFQTTVQNVQMLTGLNFPQDLHGVTLYGRSFDEQAVLVLVHATVDRPMLLGNLALAQGYQAFKHGSHEVHAWEDKGKQLYGAFAPGDIAIIGRSREHVETALDLIEGKGQPIKPLTGLAAGAKPSVIAYIAAEGLSQLKQSQQAKTPLVNDAETAWVSLGEQGENLLLQAAVSAKTPQVAEQMRASLEGIKAMLSLAAANQNADPNAKLAASALQNLNAKVQQKILNLEWRVPIDLVKKLVYKEPIDSSDAAPAEAR